jgi:hypothetical protein
MADTLEVVLSVPEELPTSALRDAVASLTDDDLSVRSPVTAGAEEVGVGRTSPGEAVLRVEGHGGRFTKTSQQAVVEAAESAHEAVTAETVNGGYTPEKT